MEKDMEYQQRVAVALEAVMDYLGMTQVEMASAGGVSTATVSRYARGLSPEISAPTLARMAESLGIPRHLLLDPPETRKEVLRALTVWDATREVAPHDA